mgnify:CR=1 FL=1
MALYEQHQALLELYQKLSEAEAESQTGTPTVSHAEMMRKMRDALNA